MINPGTGILNINNNTSNGTGYDVTLSLLKDNWVGESAQYSQTVSALGMTADKALVYAQITEAAIPTDEEISNYNLINGYEQSLNSITFYANEKPAIDLKIRAFCGSGTEISHDLDIVSDTFDSSKSYEIGDYFIKGDFLCKVITAFGAGEFDESKVETTTVAKELESIKSNIVYVDVVTSFAQIASGEYASNAISINAPEGYEIMNLTFKADYSPHISFSWTISSDAGNTIRVIAKNNYSSALTVGEVTIRKWFFKS